MNLSPALCHRDASYLQNGNRAFERGQYADAIQWYEHAIAADCRLTPILSPSIRRAETRLRKSGRELPKRRFMLWPAEPPPEERFETIAGGAPAIQGAPTVLVVAHAVGKRLFGAERSLLDMARGAYEGARCNVVVSLPSRNSDYIKLLAPFANKILVHEYGPWQQRRSLESHWVEQFCAVIEKFDIRLVHVNTIMLREPLVAARACSVPALVHGREIIGTDTHLQEIIGYDAELITQHIRHLAFRIISNSSATQRALDPAGYGYVLPNPVDVAAFAQAVQGRECFQHRAGKALAVGLISSNLPKKGVEDFLRLALECAAQGINARFLVIGPRTRYARSLMRRAEFRRLSSVWFTGYIPDASAAIARTQVICNFSNVAESFGRTVLEGMAAGRPAVVYDHGALPELVEDHQTGFVIPFGKPELAVPILQKLATDPDYLQQIGENARQRAARDFDTAQYGRRTREIYEDALRNWKICADVREKNWNV